MKFLTALLGLALGANAQAGVTLAGDTIDAGMYRTVDTGRGTGRIMGFGLDQPFVVEEGTADQKRYSVAYTLDVDGHSFMMDYQNIFHWGEGIVFRLSDLDFSNGAALASLKVDTNMTGYRVNVGADFVELDMSGVRGNRDIYFRGSFVTAAAAVPEPGSLPLLALGIGAFALGRSRMRRRAA